MIYISGKGYDTESFLTWGEVIREVGQWDCLSSKARNHSVTDYALNVWHEHKNGTFYESDFDMWFSDNIKDLLAECGWKVEEK